MEIRFEKFDVNTQLLQHQKLFAESFPEVYYADSKYAATYKQKFLHQYHSFPNDQTSYQYVAMMGNEMVGFYAAIPYRYKIKQNIVQAGMVCGVMTSPKHRKLGIFANLGNYAAEQQKINGVIFNLTFPIRKAVMPGFMRMGWDIAFEMPLYMKLLKVTSLLKSKKMGSFSGLINPFLSAYNFLLRSKDNKGIIINVFTQVEEVIGYNEFYETWSNSLNNTLVKDKDFIKWRYGGVGKEYLFFCAYNNENRLIGFVSARPIVREGVPSYGILDFMVTDASCLPNLHNALYNKAKIEEKEAIMMMMSRTSSKKYSLLKNGYLRSPFKFHLIIKNLDDKLSKGELIKEDQWHLMFVDSDDL